MRSRFHRHFLTGALALAAMACASNPPASVVLENGPAAPVVTGVPTQKNPDRAGAPQGQSQAQVKDPLLSAVGIGVSDLKKSRDFYVNIMGMEFVRTYELVDMNEVLLRYPDGESYLVLMHWIDGSPRTYRDLPIKLVTRTKDPVALAAKIRAAGYEVTREPRPSDQVGGAVVGFAKDPDGYVLELLPLRPTTAAAGSVK